MSIAYSRGPYFAKYASTSVRTNTYCLSIIIEHWGAPDVSLRRFLLGVGALDPDDVTLLNQPEWLSSSASS